VLNKGQFAKFVKDWLPWQHPLSNCKRGPDQQNSRKCLPFGEKIVKIGTVDDEIFSVDLNKKKKLRKVK